MPDLLARIDYILAELTALKAELAAEPMPAAKANGADPEDDFAPEHMIDITAAQERYGHPRNTIAKWAREEGIGVRRGGRWLVSVPRLRRRLNGG